VGVDNVWEQEKLEARKMPENGDESHLSSAPNQGGGPSFFPKGHMRVLRTLYWVA
jgi:hypothetical protein